LNLKNIGYWLATAIVVFVLLAGGAASLSARPENAQGMKDLGYPVYLMTILGVWKMLGGLALLAPRLPRLKEWAYAGIFFDFTGAVCSHVAVGSDTRHVVVPAVFAVVALASWALRPPSRVLGEIVATRARA
jgi:uncharacterized membrane protein YphA (DoxX/SURF4 family)